MSRYTLTVIDIETKVTIPIATHKVDLPKLKRCRLDKNHVMKHIASSPTVCLLYTLTLPTICSV